MDQLGSKFFKFMDQFRFSKFMEQLGSKFYQFLDQLGSQFVKFLASCTGNSPSS